jgi:hypothetical protein
VTVAPVRLDPKTVHATAAKYDPGYDRVVEELVPAVQARRFLTRDEFLITGCWKSPRAIPKLESNDADHIEEATRIALHTPVEQLRIGVLHTLSGVSHPMASVILHWFHNDPYPILDFRALESLDISMPKLYTQDFWLDYVTRWRQALDQSGADKRTLDRALWQWSKNSR